MFLPFLMNNSYCWILFCHHLEIYLFRKLLGRWKVLLAARELEQRVSREEWASDRYRDLSIFPLMWIEINIKNITKVQITWEIYYWPPKLAHYRFYKNTPLVIFVTRGHCTKIGFLSISVVFKVMFSLWTTSIALFVISIVVCSLEYVF